MPAPRAVPALDAVERLVLDALLLTALLRRRPTQRVLARSGEETLYGSEDGARCCHADRLDPATSRRGKCRDDAVAESFFSSLKKDRIRKRLCKTRGSARADVFDDIDAFYDRTRRRDRLDGVRREAFERAAA